MAEVRRKGYAVDNEELEYGLICVGKAIVDCDGNPIGAVSISGPSSRMSEEKIKRCADYLNQYCARISAELTCLSKNFSRILVSVPPPGAGRGHLFPFARHRFDVLHRSGE